MKNRLYITMLLACVLGVAGSRADIPAGYYDDCEGKCRSALKTQLYHILKDHTRITYSSGTWPAFEYTDASADGTYWIDIYTHEQVSVSGHSGMNIEHSFPKSWWSNPTKSDYAWCDLVHLMPVNEWANNDRNNHPFAEVREGGEKAPNYRCPSPNYRLGAPVEGQAAGANIVFEPADEYKGDMARTYFYMVTCYQNLTWSADGLRTAQQGDWPTLQPWAVEMLLRWHREDPVSDKERSRNDGVYSQQHNRNPFIDHPEMVEHIWGDLQDQAWHNGEIVTPPDPPVPDKPEILAPSPDDIFYFDANETGTAYVRDITLLATGLTHSLVARIFGPDEKLFSIMTGGTELKALTINAADLMSSQGYMLRISYRPDAETETAPHVATLNITGRDIEVPVSVRLEGECKTLSVSMPEVNEDSDARYFTLDGCQLPGRPSLPGIYIMVIDGKVMKFVAR